MEIGADFVGDGVFGFIAHGYIIQQFLDFGTFLRQFLRQFRDKLERKKLAACGGLAKIIVLVYIIINTG